MKTILNLLGKLPFWLQIIIMILVVVVIRKIVPSLTWAIIFIEIFLAYIFFFRSGKIVIEHEDSEENPYVLLTLDTMKNRTEDQVRKFINVLSNGIIQKDPHAINFINSPQTRENMNSFCAAVNISKCVTLKTQTDLIELLKATGLPITAVPPTTDFYDPAEHAKYNLGLEDWKDPNLLELVKKTAAQPTEENTKELINYFSHVVVSHNYSSRNWMEYMYYCVSGSGLVTDSTKDSFKKVLLAQGIEEKELEQTSIYKKSNTRPRETSKIKVVRMKGQEGSQFKVDNNLLKQETKRLAQANVNNQHQQYNNTTQNQVSNEFMQQEMMRQQNEFMQQEMMRQQVEFAMEEARKSVTPFDMGGYVQGDGFNPSDTAAADAMRQAEQMNQMNDMNNMGGMGMF